LAWHLHLNISENKKLYNISGESEDTMENKKVVDKRSVNLEHVMSADYIPIGCGRPERETVIGKDDMMNVEIALNISVTIDDLLKQI
jgi:hypothetical protein